MQHYKRRFEMVDTGLKKVSELKEFTANRSELSDNLDTLKKGWTAQKNQLRGELDAVQFKLDETLSNKQSVVDILGNMLSQFFAERCL